MRRYIPERGDAIWLSLAQDGTHEQSGRRPALVLSPRAYNERSGLAIVCPMTSEVKGYPFEVASILTGRAGAVLADHVRSVDWMTRGAKRAGRLSPEITERVSAIVAKLIGA